MELGKWGEGSERSWSRGKCDQNILYKYFFSNRRERRGGGAEKARPENNQAYTTHSIYSKDLLPLVWSALPKVSIVL